MRRFRHPVSLHDWALEPRLEFADDGRQQRRRGRADEAQPVVGDDLLGARRASGSSDAWSAPRCTMWARLLHLGEEFQRVEPRRQNTARRATAARKDRRSGRGYEQGHDVERPVVFGKLERGPMLRAEVQMLAWRRGTIFGREVVPECEGSAPRHPARRVVRWPTRGAVGRAGEPECAGAGLPSGVRVETATPSFSAARRAGERSPLRRSAPSPSDLRGRARTRPAYRRD